MFKEENGPELQVKKALLLSCIWEYPLKQSEGEGFLMLEDFPFPEVRNI